MSVEPLHTPEEGETASESAEAEVRYLHPVEDTPDGAAEDAEAHADAVGEEAQGESESESAGRLAVLTPWLVQVFTPASGLYTERQPTIAEIVRRARDGDQLPDSGPLRFASQAHGYSHAAFVVVADTAKWLAAHPARLGVLCALVAVALAFPATRHVAGFLLTPVAWAHQALT